jgi:hypothetical protein
MTTEMHINNVMGPFKVGNIVILSGEFYNVEDKTVLYRVYPSNTPVQVTETVIEMPISKKVKDVDNESYAASVASSEVLEIRDIVSDDDANAKEVSEDVAMKSIETPKPETPVTLTPSPTKVNFVDLLKKNTMPIENIKFKLGFIPAEPCKKLIVTKGEVKTGEKSKRIKDNLFACADVCKGVMKVVIHGEGVTDKMNIEITLWNKAIFNVVLEDEDYEVKWDGTPEYINKSPIVFCKEKFFEDEFYVLVQNLEERYPDYEQYKNFNHYDKDIILAKKCTEQCISNEKWPKYLKKMHLKEDEAIFVIGNGTRVGDKFNVIYAGFEDDPEPKQIEVVTEN